MARTGISRSKPLRYTVLVVFIAVMIAVSVMAGSSHAKKASKTGKAKNEQDPALQRLYESRQSMFFVTMQHMLGHVRALPCLSDSVDSDTLPSPLVPRIERKRSNDS